MCLLAFITISCNPSTPLGNPVNPIINNADLRRDITGEIIDAHDGCLQYFNGHFYLYGTAYGKTDGFTNNSFHVYSSPDLQQWTLEGDLLGERTKAIYYRPYVVFNPNTHKYVLWYNWYSSVKDWVGHEGVAVADTPAGPFIITNSDVALAHPNNGDGSLFVDDDGTGYFIYTSIGDGYTERVERLTKDFFHATGQTSQMLTVGGEAPVLFRRGNIYYALCGPRCAFCPEGSEVQVFTATSPLGPFTTQPQANINRRTQYNVQATPAKQVGVMSVDTPGGVTKLHPSDNSSIMPAGNVPIIPAQQTWVARLPSTNGMVYLWMGDRWQSCPDGIKGHDFQFWAPLEFSGDGQILPLKGLAYFQLNLKP